MNQPAMVMGIETEYSIYVREIGDMAYKTAVAEAGQTIRDCVRDSIEAMGESVIVTRRGGRPSVQHIANGSRFYLDSMHPEMSTAEGSNPREVVIWDAAGERIVQAAAERASKKLDYTVSLYKKLVDGHGQTWGCHENFCITPRLFYRIVQEDDRTAEQKTLASWLVVRQLLIGAGKIGTDYRGPRCGFQLSQRAEFIIKFRNALTTANRPLINTRDEALADENHWRRLHLICGDANLCQWSTYIKMGLTGLMLLMWQDRNLQELAPLPVIDDDYPKVMQFMSRDSDLLARYPVRFLTGKGQLGGKRHMSAADILSYYVEAMAVYAQKRQEWSSAAEAEAYREAASKAQWAAGLLRKGSWRSLYGWLDWPTKRIVAEEYLRRKNRNWEDVLTDPQLFRRVSIFGDINYSALDPAVSIFSRLTKAGVIKTVVRNSEITRAMLHPTPGRATARSMLINAYPTHVLAAHWNSIEYKQKDDSVQVILGNPMGCDLDQLEISLRASATPADLVAFLTQFPIPGVAAYYRK